MHTPSNKDIVPFEDVNILTFSENDQHYIAIKPLCDQFGIQWRAQRRKLHRDDLFNSTVSVKDTVGADGKRREMTCLPLKVFPMWLARINTSRLKNAQAADLILKFQKEATQVLYEHFMGATRPEAMQMRFQLAEMQAKYKKTKKKMERSRLNRKMAHTDWTWHKLERIHQLKQILSWAEIGKIYDYSGAYMAQLERQYRYATGQKVAELPRELRQHLPEVR